MLIKRDKEFIEDLNKLIEQHPDVEKIIFNFPAMDRWDGNFYTGRYESMYYTMACDEEEIFYDDFDDALEDFLYNNPDKSEQEAERIVKEEYNWIPIIMILID